MNPRQTMNRVVLVEESARRLRRLRRVAAAAVVVLVREPGTGAKSLRESDAVAPARPARSAVAAGEGRGACEPGQAPGACRPRPARSRRGRACRPRPRPLRRPRVPAAPRLRSPSCADTACCPRAPPGTRCARSRVLLRGRRHGRRGVRVLGRPAARDPAEPRALQGRCVEEALAKFPRADLAPLLGVRVRDDRTTRARFETLGRLLVGLGRPEPVGPSSRVRERGSCRRSVGSGCQAGRWAGRGVPDAATRGPRSRWASAAADGRRGYPA
jgi:hypothetical protein